MAYLALVSLQETIEILCSDLPLIFYHCKNEIESLSISISQLKSFILYESHTHTKQVQEKIKDAVSEAECIIATYLSIFLVSSQSINDHSFSVFLQQLSESVKQIRSIVEEVKKLDYYGRHDNYPGRMLRPSGLSGCDSSGDNAMVGFEDVLQEVKDKLNQESLGLDVISVVGMGGIGKTTLVRNVFHDSSIASHFETRAWITVSPEYCVRDILLSLLDSIGVLNDEMYQESDDMLEEYLQECLRDKKYLIVADDVWDNRFWYRVRHLFPDEQKGSRVVITTRILDKYNSFTFYKMRFLRDDESWNLLCKEVFAEESCPPGLEKIGRKIAHNCEGHPVAILTAGRLLRGAEKQQEAWKNISENKSLVVDEALLKILSLSFEHLPQHLKACFLYMGLFPEDADIPVSKLFKLWHSEGFIDPAYGLEERGQNELMYLADSSLVLVQKINHIGRIKTCRIHGVIRDLCVREAQKERFFHFINRFSNDLPEGTDRQRRFRIHPNILLGMKDMKILLKSVPFVHSLLCTGPYHQYPLQVYLAFALLRVLDVLAIRFFKFPIEIVNLVMLRYLAFTYNGPLPASVSKLKNLMYLILQQHLNIKYRGPSYLPIEIWSMSKLKHLEVMGRDILDSSTAEARTDEEKATLMRLLTLKGVSSYTCTKEVLQNVPNLRKLGIRIESLGDAPSQLDGLFFPEQLESLKLVVVNPIPNFQASLLREFSFPGRLVKLTLSGLGFPWEYMHTISKLPNLKLLKLRCHAFKGPEWTSTQGSFFALNSLVFEDLDLGQWRAAGTCFPNLKCLHLKHCYQLQNIPREIAKVPNLKLIELIDCSHSAITSAKMILEERQARGNSYLEVVTHSSWSDELQ